MISNYEPFNYAKDVLDNKIIHGRELQLVMERHERDLQRISDNTYPYTFDTQKADRAINFIQHLKLYEGTQAGKYFLLEPFQKFIIASLFGWVRKDNGLRRFDKAYIFIGKGNGKSPLMAAIALYIFLTDSGAQVYSLATEMKQSQIILNHMKGFILQDDRLRDEIGVFYNSLSYKKKFSSFRPLSKNTVTGGEGFVPSCIVADEIGAMRDDRSFSTVLDSLFKRPEALLLMITHANYYPYSPGYQHYQYAQKILNQLVEDERYFAILYTLDESDEWFNPDIIRKANPASFINMEELVKKQKDARNLPSSERGYRVKNLNQWLLGMADNWIQSNLWDDVVNQEDEFKSYLTEDKLKTYPCSMGADLAKRDDFTAIATAWWIAEIKKIYVRVKYFIPRPQIVEKLKTDSPMIVKWIQDGYIVATELPTIDNQRVLDYILYQFDTYKPSMLYYDIALSQELEQNLELRLDTNIMPISQKSIISSEATKDLSEYILNKKIISNNPVLKWNALNAKVETWNNFLKLIKSHKDSPERVDGISALIMALIGLKDYVMQLPVQARVEEDINIDIIW